MVLHTPFLQNFQLVTYYAFMFYISWSLVIIVSCVDSTAERNSPPVLFHCSWFTLVFSVGIDIHTVCGL